MAQSQVLEQVQAEDVKAPKARKTGFAVTKPGRVRVPNGFWKQGGAGYAAVTNTDLTLDQAADMLAAWGVYPATIAWYRKNYGLPVDVAAATLANKEYATAGHGGLPADVAAAK